MSISFNGTDISAINYNGTSLSKVIYNGTEVWSSFTPAFYCWINGYNGSTYVGTCYRLKQGTTAWELIHTDNNGIGSCPVMAKNGGEVAVYSNSSRSYVYQYAPSPFTTWANSKCGTYDIAQFKAAQTGLINGNSTLVGIDAMGMYMSTNGGATFTYSDTFPQYALDVYYVNGQFFALYKDSESSTYRFKLYRYNGSSWVMVHSFLTNVDTPWDVGFGYANGTYCLYYWDFADSSATTKTQRVTYSTNLSTWTTSGIAFSGTSYDTHFNAISSNGNIIVAKGNDTSTLFYSADGVTFTRSTKSAVDMFSNGTDIVIVCDSGQSYKTTNGTTWTTLTGFVTLPSSRNTYMNYVE